MQPSELDTANSHPRYLGHCTAKSDFLACSHFHLASSEYHSQSLMRSAPQQQLFSSPGQPGPSWKSSCPKALWGHLHTKSCSFTPSEGFRKQDLRRTAEGPGAVLSGEEMAEGRPHHSLPERRLQWGQCQTFLRWQGTGKQPQVVPGEA